MIPALVLDTSVLIAGLRSSLGASFALMQMVGREKFTLGLTTALVLEYESVCMRSPGDFGLSGEAIAELLDYWCSVGRRAPIRFRTRPAVSDPGDELVLEAAVAARCDWIVTHNVRHLATGASRYGIEVVKPGEALKRLEELS